MHTLAKPFMGYQAGTSFELKDGFLWTRGHPAMNESVLKQYPHLWVIEGDMPDFLKNFL